MARRPTYTRSSEIETKVRELEHELWVARTAIIDLMSEPAREILKGHYRHEMNSWGDAWHWAERAAEQIVELCEDVQQATYQGYPMGAPRANCPLCGRGTSGPYAEGFALPEGLVRHLTGSHNSRQCDVLRAALGLARSSADSSFKFPR